jgi:restriction endonuclease S subunit
MKLKSGKWKLISIGEVVNELRITTNDPVKEGFEYYIGFEHIESENLQIREFGNINDGINFSKTFKEGDILFGKIRAYLKKVAVAPFSGLCSGDILVLRTKDKNILKQEFLPYIITTDSFYKLAIDTSIGTTMPRTKWQHISKHIFPLPSLDEQQKIVDLLQSIEQNIMHAKEQEKILKDLALTAIKDLTSESPKLGKVVSKQKLLKTTLGEVAFEYSKREDNPQESIYDRYVGSDSIGRFDFKVEKWQSANDVISSMKIFEPKDYLLVRRSLYASDFRERAPRADFYGLCSGDILTIKENNEWLYDGYLLIILNNPKLWEYIVANASGSITRRVKWNELSKFEISIPDIDTQKLIVEFFNQIQFTLQKIRQQKVNLMQLKQNLLNEILG